MDNKTKKQYLKSIHQAYLEESDRSGLQAQPSEALKTRILSAFQHARHEDRAPEEREVTILLSDLRGFTALSETYSPLEVIDLLNRYFTAMSEVIGSYGGTIDKFMGDAILVVFGSPEREQDDLERALACSVAMQNALSEINQSNQSLGYPPLYMGIGINTGTVVAGKLGTDLYSEFTVIGDPVNLASRLESYSLRGQILISEHTFQKAQDMVETGQVISPAVKGKQQPVKMYELLAVTEPEYMPVPVREDRRSPRIEVNLPLSFYRVENKAVSETATQGTIIDLSYGGMYLSCEEQLPPLAEIRFPLSMSLSANIQSDVYAKVIRINPRPHGFHYHLEFSDISEAARLALRSYIDRIIEGI